MDDSQRSVVRYTSHTQSVHQSRLLTSSASQHYGATAPTQFDRHRAINPPYDEDEESPHSFMPRWNEHCFPVFVAVSCAIVLAVIFYFAGIGERHPSTPISPEPRPPVEHEPIEHENYRNSGIYWDSPRSLECIGEYQFRQYHAQLPNVSHERGFDAQKACEALDIEIKGHYFDSPEHCRRDGLYMYGYWTVYDPSDCTIDDEIQRYRKAGIFWDAVVRAEHCHTYDKREFKAQLLNIPPSFDWMKACIYIPVRIQDEELEVPYSCELRDSVVWGKWLVSNQLDCRPYWGPLHDVGCQASGKKRYEAPLWNLNEMEERYRSPMCYTTPATWHGIYYAHPSACDDRVSHQPSFTALGIIIFLPETWGNDWNMGDRELLTR